MLEGLARWNDDRARAARAKGASLLTYSGHLKCATNKLAEEVLNKKLDPSFVEPRKYTGL
jgi:hypothetical protein